MGQGEGGQGGPRGAGEGAAEMRGRAPQENGRSATQLSSRPGRGKGFQICSHILSSGEKGYDVLGFFNHSYHANVVD